MIMINFWGVLYLNDFQPYSVFTFNSFTDESIREMIIISVILLIITIAFFKVDRKKLKRTNFIVNKDYVWIIYVFYIAFLLLAAWSFNYDMDNSTRGEGQFELSKRAGVAGILGSVGVLAIPFSIFCVHYKTFGEKTKVFIPILLTFMILSNISNGGRRVISYIFISFTIYYYYFYNLKKSSMTLILSIAIVLLGVSMVIRSFGTVNEGSTSLQENIATSFLQVNSSSGFLWLVKEYSYNGIRLYPTDFLMHFVSLLLPSFAYASITGNISYRRGSLFFDNLFNDNPDQGYDFMLLADYYWCFGYFGYVLYILTIAFVFYFFKKYIYSGKPWMFITAILMVLFIGQQRNDFGAILKPVFYSFVLIYLLAKITLIPLSEKDMVGEESRVNQGYAADKEETSKKNIVHRGIKVRKKRIK